MPTRMHGTGAGWLSISALLCVLNWIPAAIASASTRDFLAHCETAPEPCKHVMFAYIKFLVDGGFVDACVMHMPAEAVAKKIIEEMRNHSDRSNEEWIDGLEDALKVLKLCGD